MQTSAKNIYDPMIMTVLDGKFVAGYGQILCDLDGCLMTGGQYYRDSADFVAACGDRLWIVSNNSTHSAKQLSGIFGAAGLVVPEQRILLAGEQTLLRLARLPGPRTLRLYSGPALIDLARELEFDLDAPKPAHVLLCRSAGFVLPDLTEIVRLVVAGGARLWVANTDVSHPGPDGLPVPETGALLAALHAIVPALQFETMGKPSPDMIGMALAATGVMPGNAVFVDDNLDTGGRAAHSAGVIFLQLQRKGERK